MPVDKLHAEFEAFLPKWIRAREVIAGEDAIKAAGERYLPRLESQTDEEYSAYVARGAFFNGTARTAEGFAGMIFRREPVVRLPSDGRGLNVASSRLKEGQNGEFTVESAKDAEKLSQRNGSGGPSPHLGKVFETFEADVDLLGTPLYSFAKRLTGEVLAVGRAGTLIEWNDAEQRAFLASYQAEQIINWRMVRVGGRNELGLVVLRETTDDADDADYFEAEVVEQIRVLRLVRSTNRNFTAEDTEIAVEGRNGEAAQVGRGGTRPSRFQYVVELWRRGENQGPSRTGQQREWVLVERKVPMRRGRPLTAIPFVFHGPYDSQPSCAKPPLDDVIAVNLDHYRLDADYKHGLHFTALPTAWVSGFHKDAQLRIGSSTAWVTDTIGAHAGFLEFTGQGLTTFERAMDRAEKLMAILGSRLLESQKRVSESAEALSLRQAGEGSIVANISGSISKGVTQILLWVLFWHSSAGKDEGRGMKEIGEEVVSFTLNQDFETATMTPQELTALVAAWQAGAVSTETLHNLMRRGEVLEPSRSNEEETTAIHAEKRGFTTESAERSGTGGVLMHSEVESLLLKRELIDFLPDSEGKMRIKVFQGRRVIVDDGCPKVNGTNSPAYTTYLFGSGAFAWGEGSLDADEQVETNRDTLASDDLLAVRRRFILHPRGVKWVGVPVDDSPSNTELAVAASWQKVFSDKNIRVVAVRHNV